MSFGVSASDFLLLIQLAQKTASGCKHAPSDFAEAGRGAESLHIILSTCEAEVKREDSVLHRNPLQAEQFGDLLDNCRAPLQRLDAILTKHASLGTASPKVLDRFRIPRKDLLDIRGQLVLHNSYLATFLKTVGLTSSSRIEKELQDLGSSNARLEGASHRLLDGNARIVESMAQLQLSEARRVLHDQQQAQQQASALDASTRELRRGAQSIDDRAARIEHASRRIESSYDSIEARLGGIQNVRDDIREMQYAILATVDKLGAQARQPGSLAPTILSDHSCDDKDIWRQLRSDLQREGFTSSDVLRHQDAIRGKLRELIDLGLWDSEVGGPPSSSNGERMHGMDSVQRGGHHNRIASKMEGDLRTPPLTTSPLRTPPPSLSHLKTPLSTMPPSTTPQGVDTRTTLNLYPPLPVQRDFGNHAKIDEAQDARVFVAHSDGGADLLATTEGPGRLGSVSGRVPQTEAWTSAGLKEDASRLPRPRSYSNETAISPGQVPSSSPQQSPPRRSERKGRQRSTKKIPWIYRKPNDFKVPEMDDQTPVTIDLLIAAYDGDVNTVVSQLQESHGTEFVNSTALGNRLPENEWEEWRVMKRSTPLFRAVYNGHFEVVHELLRYRASPNARGLHAEKTALHWAMIVHERELVRLLLEYGAVPAFKDNTGLSALDVAVDKGATDLVQLFLDLGPDLDVTDSSLLNHAVSKRHWEIARMFLEYGVRASGASLLAAVQARNATTVARLLDYGANPDGKRGEFGRTLLYEAASSGRIELVELLLRHGADPNVKNDTSKLSLKLMASVGYRPPEVSRSDAVKFNEPPLFAAARIGHVEIAKALIAAGAHHDIDIGGKTAMTIAKSRKKKEMVEFLAEKDAISKLYPLLYQREHWRRQESTAGFGLGTSSITLQSGGQAL